MCLYARADVELCSTDRVMNHGYERRADRLWSLFQRGCPTSRLPPPDHYDGMPDGYLVTITLFPCDTPQARGKQPRQLEPMRVNSAPTISTTRSPGPNSKSSANDWAAEMIPALEPHCCDTASPFSSVRTPKPRLAARAGRVTPCLSDSP